MRSGSISAERQGCQGTAAVSQRPIVLGRTPLLCYAAAAGRRSLLRTSTAPNDAWAGRRPVHTAKTAAVETPATTPTDEPLASPEARRKFNWFKSWYPVAVLDGLRTDRPNPLKLLGLSLVAWKAPDGTWSVLEDACPHRLAPLSEGRIHGDGTLMCSYHGWTFDGSGACASIPQIGDPKALATACASGRSCVKRYPSKELFGLLWVWADAGPSALAESEAAPPSAAPPELLSGEWEHKQYFFQRDVPVSFDTLVENIVDPAHVQFSHHGVIGNRGAPAESVAALEGEITCDGGFSAAFGGPGARVRRVAFRPPCLSSWEFAPTQHMTLYATPTRVGWTRVFVNMRGPVGVPLGPPNPTMPPLVRAFIRVIAANPWLQHAIQHNHILDGDDYFLHQGERLFHSRGGLSSWRRQYFMPASADAAVAGWRRWLDEFGGDMPLLPRSVADLGPVLPKREMYDRYHQHTVNCPHCLAALRNITVAAALLAAASAVSFGAVVAAFTMGSAPLLSAFCGGAAAFGAVAAAAVAGLLRFRELFVYYEYSHQDHA